MVDILNFESFVTRVTDMDATVKLHCSPGFGLLGKTTFNARYDDITVVVGLVEFVILICTRFQHYKKMVE